MTTTPIDLDNMTEADLKALAKLAREKATNVRAVEKAAAAAVKAAYDAALVKKSFRQVLTQIVADVARQDAKNGNSAFHAYSGLPVTIDGREYTVNIFLKDLAASAELQVRTAAAQLAQPVEESGGAGATEVVEPANA